MNRDGGGKPGRAGRQLTDEEAELWHYLSRSVDKVKTKTRVPPQGETALLPRPAPARASGQAPRRVAEESGPSPAAAEAPSRSQASIELDRRGLRQVATGKVPIDARLDLHGLRQHTAHARLRAFLVSSQAKGHRMVLVITGKGAGAGRHDQDTEPFSRAERGVLRRSVPLWLEGPDLRAVVLSYASAGVKHGGDGALYVRLRKLRTG